MASVLAQQSGRLASAALQKQAAQVRAPSTVVQVVGLALQGHPGPAAHPGPPPPPAFTAAARAPPCPAGRAPHRPLQPRGGGRHLRLRAEEADGRVSQVHVSTAGNGAAPAALHARAQEGWRAGGAAALGPRGGRAVLHAAGGTRDNVNCARFPAGWTLGPSPSSASSSSPPSSSTTSCPCGSATAWRSWKTCRTGCPPSRTCSRCARVLRRCGTAWRRGQRAAPRLGAAGARAAAAAAAAACPEPRRALRAHPASRPLPSQPARCATGTWSRSGSCARSPRCARLNAARLDAGCLPYAACLPSGCAPCRRPRLPAGWLAGWLAAWRRPANVWRQAMPPDPAELCPSMHAHSASCTLLGFAPVAAAGQGRVGRAAVHAPAAAHLPEAHERGAADGHGRGGCVGITSAARVLLLLHCSCLLLWCSCSCHAAAAAAAAAALLPPPLLLLLLLLLRCCRLALGAAAGLGPDPAVRAAARCPRPQS